MAKYRKFSRFQPYMVKFCPFGTAALNIELLFFHIDYNGKSSHRQGVNSLKHNSIWAPRYPFKYDVLRVVFTDQRVTIEKALFSCPATYPKSSVKLFIIAPLDYVKCFRWITITPSWVLSSFRKFNIERIGWLRLMKIVKKSLIWSATYVHLLHEHLSLFNQQVDITLMEISLLIFYEKRNP